MSFSTDTGFADPSAVNSGASSWVDVLRYGLTRAIDATYSKAVRPSNALPVVSPAGTRYTLNPDGTYTAVGAAAGFSLPSWAPLAVLGFLGYLLVKKAR